MKSYENENSIDQNIDEEDEDDNDRTDVKNDFDHCDTKEEDEKKEKEAKDDCNGMSRNESDVDFGEIEMLETKNRINEKLNNYMINKIATKTKYKKLKSTNFEDEDDNEFYASEDDVGYEDVEGSYDDGVVDGNKEKKEGEEREEEERKRKNKMSKDQSLNRDEGTTNLKGLFY